MGKKAKLYLLIAVNLFAWGYVAFKVYGALHEDEDTELNLAELPVKKIEVETREELQTLQLNYPDPFLKNVSISSKKSVSGHAAIAHKQETVSQLKPVPVKTQTVATTAVIDIKYLGLIKNSTSGSVTALLSVNGRSVVVKLNESVEGYMLKEITADQILLLRGKEKLMIRK